jgi:hypothetical protein
VLSIKFIGIALISLVTAIVFAGKLAQYRLSPAGKSGEPAAAFVPVSTFDLGSVPAGKVLETRFKVVNDGGTRLVIRKQTSNCPCVNARWKPLIVFPGATQYITLTLDTRELEGPFQFEMDYATNDPELPKFTLTLRVDVEPQGQTSTMSVSG